MGSWFLGNRGENAQILRDSMRSIVDNIEAGRKQIWPDDPVCVSTAILFS